MRWVGAPKDAWSQASCSGENVDGVAIDFAERGRSRSLSIQAKVGRENTGRGIAASCRAKTQTGMRPRDQGNAHARRGVHKVTAGHTHRRSKYQMQPAKAPNVNHV